MKIAIDARALSAPGGGEETYLRNLICALALVDLKGEYSLFLSSAQDRILRTERMQQIVVWPSNRFVRLFVTFPLALASANIDVVHAQNTVPPLCRAPVVVTIHDIGYERYPHFFIPSEVARLRALMPLMVRRAAAIITGSDYTKQDIVRRYCVPPEKIVVAPYAADPRFKPPGSLELTGAIRAKYAQGERFILCVSSLQPRKNLSTLIKSYVRLRRIDATRNKLVLVGERAWLYDEIFATARASGFEADLIFTGHVSDDELVALYGAADVFVYPSIFEGFGLPPLEAMACGTPVITSNTSSLPEVVGDAALTVDPFDGEALAEAIIAILDNHNLRTRLAARGLRRARTFSWEATARTVLGVYHDVSKH